jgi:hypothetical protein
MSIFSQRPYQQLSDEELKTRLSRPCVSSRITLLFGIALVILSISGLIYLFSHELQTGEALEVGAISCCSGGLSTWFLQLGERLGLHEEEKRRRV